MLIGAKQGDANGLLQLLKKDCRSKKLPDWHMYEHFTLVLNEMIERRQKPFWSKRSTEMMCLVKSICSTMNKSWCYMAATPFCPMYTSHGLYDHFSYWSWKAYKHGVNMAKLPYSHVKMPKLLVELQPIPCQWLALSLLITSSQANYAYGIMCLLAINMHVWLQYIYVRAGQSRRGGGWEGGSSCTNAVAGSPPTHTPWNSAHTLEPLCEEEGDFFHQASSWFPYREPRSAGRGGGRGERFV